MQLKPSSVAPGSIAKTSLALLLFLSLGYNARADEAADAYKLAQSRIQGAGFQCAAVYSAMLTNGMATVNGFLVQKYTGIDKAGGGSVICETGQHRYTIDQIDCDCRVRTVAPTQPTASAALKRDLPNL